MHETILDESVTTPFPTDALSSLPEEQQSELSQISTEFADVLPDELGKTNFPTHHIERLTNTLSNLRVNAVTVPDPFSLPRVEDLLERIGKANGLTKVAQLRDPLCLDPGGKYSVTQPQGTCSHLARSTYYIGYCPCKLAVGSRATTYSLLQRIANHDQRLLACCYGLWTIQWYNLQIVFAGKDNLLPDLLSRTPVDSAS